MVTQVPPSIERDLNFYFCELEADLGVCSTFGSQLAQACMYEADRTDWDYNGPVPKPALHGAYEHPYSDADLTRIRRGKRVRKALEWMIDHSESLLVTVLYRMHGPLPPNVDWLRYGNIAPVIAYSGDGLETYQGPVENQTTSCGSASPEATSPLDPTIEAAKALYQRAIDSYIDALLATSLA